MKHIKQLRHFPIVLITLFFGLNLVSQNNVSEEIKSKIDSVFKDYNDINKPGASVAVVKDEKIIFKKGYGSANLEYDIPNSPSTIFHIASVSKQFTAFSILLLESQGKLSFDDDIRKYIPEVPDFGKTITLRHLASHTSGLRDQWNLLAMAGWRLDDVITKEHVLKLVSKQKELNFNPGEEYTYCNTGFTLLAEVVARVSEQSFAEFTEEHIFKPLKMSNTLFYDDHEKIVKNRAYSYQSNNNGYKKSVLSYANVGATSLFTTVEDLALWSINFANPKVGNSSIIKTLNTLAVLNNGETFGGAYGQFVGKYKGLNEIQHGGADAGYRSYLTRFPDENFSVIVFSNSAQFNSGGIAHEVVDIFLKDKFVDEPKKKTNQVENVEPLEDITQNQLNGNYEIQTGVVLEITAKNDSIHVLQTWNKSSYTIINTKGNTYEIPTDSSIQFVFSELEDDKAQVLTVFQNGNETTCKRVEKLDLSAIKIEDYTGAFYSEELSTTYSFTIVDGKLIAKHSRLSDISLSLIKEDMFSGNTWFFGQIEFIRDSNNAISGCKVSSGRVRNLLFKKVKE
jgi:CubicO group peptidase (beta-lactamase class C family)